MGHIHKSSKDYRMRDFFSKNEINNIVLKYYVNAPFDVDHKTYFFYKFLNRFHLNSSSSRVVNRCLLTSRAGGVVRKFRLSRITFKEFSDKSQICGMRRVSW